MSAQRHEYDHDGARVTVTVRHVAGERYVVHVDGRAHEVAAHAMPDGRLFCRIDGRARAFDHVKVGQREQLRVDGQTWTLHPAGARARGAAASGSGRITAPMTGTITKVLVAAGEQVEAGQTLVVLSAMKMEHKLVADIAGCVAELHATAGATAEEGTLLARIIPQEGTAG